MRGDRPLAGDNSDVSIRFTPHARGSTIIEDLNLKCRVSLPRMRGDRPAIYCVLLEHFPFTPHARGSTLFLYRFYNIVQVYPACAGIDLEVQTLSHMYHSLPRMRGDRPSNKEKADDGRKFTPHARGSTFR